MTALVFGSPEALEIVEIERCIESALPCPSCGRQPQLIQALGFRFACPCGLVPTLHYRRTQEQPTARKALYEWQRSVERINGYRLWQKDSEAASLEDEVYD